MIQFSVPNVRKIQSKVFFFLNTAGQSSNSQNKSPSGSFCLGITDRVDVDLIQIIFGRLIHGSPAWLGSAGESAGYTAHSAEFTGQLVDDRFDFRVVFIFGVVHRVGGDFLERLCNFRILSQQQKFNSCC